MAKSHDIPARCYELLMAVHTSGKRIPLRDLAERLPDFGLLKVARCHDLVELVLWYEPPPGPAVEMIGNSVVVRPSCQWLPYYSMGRSSVENAVTNQASSPRRDLVGCRSTVLRQPGTMPSRRICGLGRGQGSLLRIRMRGAGGGRPQRPKTQRRSLELGAPGGLEDRRRAATDAA